MPQTSSHLASTAPLINAFYWADGNGTMYDAKPQESHPEINEQLRLKIRKEMLKRQHIEKMWDRLAAVNAHHSCRDHGCRKDRRMNRKAERRIIGDKIAQIIRTHKNDKLRIFGELVQLNKTTLFDAPWVNKVMADVVDARAVDSYHRNTSQGWINPVWADQAWFMDSPWRYAHQTHASLENPTQIAYTRNVDGLVRDIQTRTKPGKYLAQFFGDVLSQDEIREWAEKQIAFSSCKGTLKFAENDSPDDWVHVYQNGPHSCMRGEDSVKVYAHKGNGLRLAYIEIGPDDYAARAIVRNNPDGSPMGYIRVYGSEQRWITKLIEDLAAAGYDDHVNLDGVHLAKIETEHEHNAGYVCPYLDYGNGGTQHVSVMGDYLLVDPDGDIEATFTCGSIPAHSGEECDECGEFHDEDNIETIDCNGHRVCEHCRNENYTYAYGRWGQDWFPNDEVIYCKSDDEYYLESYANNRDVYQCSVTDEWYHLDDLVSCDWGSESGNLIHTDEAVCDEVTDAWGYSGDSTYINGNNVPDEFVGVCHVTGEEIDTRFAVAITVGKVRYKKFWHSDPVVKNNVIYVSADALTADELTDNWVRCGNTLLPNTYYGNRVDCFAPDNVKYGSEYPGDRIEDLILEAAEDAEALAEAA